MSDNCKRDMAPIFSPLSAADPHMSFLRQASNFLGSVGGEDEERRESWVNKQVSSCPALSIFHHLALGSI